MFSHRSAAAKTAPHAIGTHSFEAKAFSFEPTFKHRSPRFPHSSKCCETGIGTEERRGARRARALLTRRLARAALFAAVFELLVYADRGAAADLAFRAAAVVLAESRAAAFLALPAQPFVWADRGATALLALAAAAIVLADRRAAALLALATAPAVLAERRAAAQLALRPNAPVRRAAPANLP